MYCTNEPFTIGRLWIHKNNIDLNPEYQRESAIWSIEKQQLFIDSILNQYDVPKMYFHDIRHRLEPHHFAVVDGKQRLHTIFQFLSNNLPLAHDFSISNNSPDVEGPTGGSFFKDLSEYWQETFKSSNPSVVLIQNATEDDIEELFSRLNNGEPLNAAEKRNAKGGELARLIRTLAQNDFFTDRVKVTNIRYQHYEVAAKLLLIEKIQQISGNEVTDLKKKFLDNLVEENKRLSAADTSGLLKRVTDQLSIVNRVFSSKDPLLNKQTFLTIYYLFCKKVSTLYGDPQLLSKIREFLENFHYKRIANNEKEEEDRDPVLIEYSRLSSQGTNDMNSIKERLSILTRYFLQDNPNVEVKDQRRAFSEEERLAIWLHAGRKCQDCNLDISLDEMHADHVNQWVVGGKTKLSNARCLCVTCNTRKASHIQ